MQQKIMVPYGVKGTIKEIKAGEFTVEEVVAVVETERRRQRTDIDAEMAGSYVDVRIKRNFRRRCRL